MTYVVKEVISKVRMTLIRYHPKGNRENPGGKLIRED